MRHSERLRPRHVGSQGVVFAALSIVSVMCAATSYAAPSQISVDRSVRGKAVDTKALVGIQERPIRVKGAPDSATPRVAEAGSVARSEPRLGNAGVVSSDRGIARGIASIEVPPAKIVFDPGQLAMLEPGMEISLTLSAGSAPTTYFVTDHGRLDDGTIWKRLAGIDDPRAEGTIVVRDGAVAGWLIGPDGDGLASWRLRPTTKGSVSVLRRRGGATRELVGAEDPNLGGVAGGDRPEPGGVASSTRSRQGLETGCEDCAAEVLDVAFFYTTALVDALIQELVEQGVPEDFAPFQAKSNIETEVALQVVNANNALENSALEARVIRVGALIELVWDESSADLLDIFASGSGDVGGRVAFARDVYGADMCVLMSATSGGSVPDSGFGEAMLWSDWDQSDPESPKPAFSYMIYDELDGASLPYLLGRKLGLGGVAGDVGVDPTTCLHVCIDRDDPDGDPLCPTFGTCCHPLASSDPSNAWRFVSPAIGFSCIRTLMAGAEGGGIQVLYYSNPAVSYFGVPTGSSATTDRHADNASVFRENFKVATAFRCAAPPFAPIDGLSETQQQLLPGGLTSFDGFGTAVASNGVYLFASAPRQGTEVPESGAVYQFINRGTPNEPLWLRARRLAPELAGLDGGFGTSIAADREWLVVGSPRTDLLDENGMVLVDEFGQPRFPEVGAVFVYRDLAFCEEEDGGDPCPPADPDYCLATIIQPEPGLGAQVGGEFGVSVDLASGLLVVGQPGYTDANTGQDVGRVRFYSLASALGTVEEIIATSACPGDFNGDGKVDGGDFGVILIEWGEDCSGGCVADLDGDGVVDGGDVGAFLVFWGECGLDQQNGQVPGQRLGDSVAISTPDPTQVFQSVIVGSPDVGTEEEPQLAVGKADAFLVFKTSDEDYEIGFLASLASPWPEQAGRFGAAMTAIGDTFAIGAPDAEISGRVPVYRIGLDEFGDTAAAMIQVLTGDLDGTAPPQAAGFGASLDAFEGLPYDGDKIEAIVVGSPLWDKPLTEVSSLVDMGTAILFGRPVWATDELFAPLDRVDDGMAKAGDRLGSSVSLVGASVVVGSPLENQFGFLAGAAFVQEIEYNDCNENGIEDSLEIYTGQASDTNNDGFPDECILGDCDADIDGNGVVDGTDLGLLFIDWGPCPDCPDPSEPNCPELCPADLNLDGLVDGNDLGDLFLSWGLDDCPINP